MSGNSTYPDLCPVAGRRDFPDSMKSMLVTYAAALVAYANLNYNQRRIRGIFVNITLLFVFLFVPLLPATLLVRDIVFATYKLVSSTSRQQERMNDERLERLSAEQLRVELEELREDPPPSKLRYFLAAACGEHTVWTDYGGIQLEEDEPTMTTPQNESRRSDEGGATEDVERSRTSSSLNTDERIELATLEIRATPSDAPASTVNQAEADTGVEPQIPSTGSPHERPPWEGVISENLYGNSTYGIFAKVHGPVIWSKAVIWVPRTVLRQTEHDPSEQNTFGKLGRLMGLMIILTQCMGSTIYGARRLQQGAATVPDARVFAAAVSGLCILLQSIVSALMKNIWREYDFDSQWFYPAPEPCTIPIFEQPLRQKALYFLNSFFRKPGQWAIAIALTLYSLGSIILIGHMSLSLTINGGTGAFQPSTLFGPFFGIYDDGIQVLWVTRASKLIFLYGWLVIIHYLVVLVVVCYSEVQLSGFVWYMTQDPHDWEARMHMLPRNVRRGLTALEMMYWNSIDYMYHLPRWVAWMWRHWGSRATWRSGAAFERLSQESVLQSAIFFGLLFSFLVPTWLGVIEPAYTLQKWPFDHPDDSAVVSPYTNTSCPLLWRDPVTFPSF